MDLDRDVDGTEVEVRHVRPSGASKTYLCPGCNGDIRPATAHVVVVPVAEPDLRRHWHRACWEHRHRRRPGRPGPPPRH